MNSTLSVGDCPLVTVLMAVYNGAAFLHEAIDSILGQTLSDFEFLIVNDASTDNTRSIIESYCDQRIHLIENKTTMGLAASLNRGLDVAKGTYIARMDCDDVSFAHRLERQVQFLEMHHEVCVCGSWVELVDEDGRILEIKKRPSGKRMQRLYWVPSPVIHPSAMIRRSQLGDVRYDEALCAAQDYDLWLRLNKTCTIENVPEILLRYRVHENSVTSRRRAEQLQITYSIFTKSTGIRDVSYEEFLSLIGCSFQLNPIRRMFLSARMAKHLGTNYAAFLWADTAYLKHWLINACRRS